MADLNKIRTIAKDKGISLAQLAKSADITPQALNGILNSNSTRVDTLEKIASVLDVSPAIFFDDVRYNSVSINTGISQSDGATQNINQSSDQLIFAMQKQIETLTEIIKTITSKQ